MKESPQPGEVWRVDFGYDGKLRAALGVSVADRNSRLAVASDDQITTQYAGTPYEMTLPRVPWLREQSHCNAQTVQPVKWVEFQCKTGKFESGPMKQVQTALRLWLCL